MRSFLSWLIRRSTPLGGVQDGVEINLLHYVGDELASIGLIEDRVAALDTYAIAVAAQQAGAQAVKRGNRGAVARSKVFDSPPHLLGRLVGEGDGGDFVGGDGALGDQVRDAVSDYPRLTATWPGEDQHRPFAVDDGLPLGLS